MGKQGKPRFSRFFRRSRHEIGLYSALRKTPAVRLDKNQNLNFSEVVNFPLDIDGYKAYNTDYNNVTMR